MNPRKLILSLALTGLAGAAFAQTPTVLVTQGDPILGVGNARSIERFAINDHGEWLILLDTSGGGDPDTDFAVIRNGFLTLQEGTPLIEPDNSTLDEFASITLNNHGDSAWEFEITGTMANQGAFFNTKAVFLQGEPMNCEGYHEDAAWLIFNGAVKFNDLNQILMGSNVADNSIPGSADDSLILAQVDEFGELISIQDVAHELGPAPNLGDIVIKSPAIGSGSQFGLTMDLNNRGDYMWQAKLDGVNNNRDRVIYRNDQVMAREGDPAFNNFTWTSLQNVPMDMNDRGDYAFRAQISAPTNQDTIIFKQGRDGDKTLIAQERKTTEFLDPYLYDNFGLSAPVKIANTGDVFFFANWTGPNATDTGILCGPELLVRETLTRLNDLQINTLSTGGSLYEISPGGRYLIFWATLENDDQVAALLDLGRVTPLDDCGGNDAKLFRHRGFAIAGETVTLALDDGQGAGVTPFLMLSDRTIPGYPDCGQVLPFGELVIDFEGGNPFMVLIGTPWGGDLVEIDLAIANNPLLINQLVYAQGIFFDVGDQIPAPAFSLTNAVEIEIGAN